MKKVFLTLVMFLLAFTGVVRADELTVHDGSNTNGYVPVYGFYADAYLKCEMVYPATELVDMANSEISQMTFYASQSSVDWGIAEFQVFLAEVADATISDFAGPGTIVYEGSLGISGNQMVVTFDTPFTYTGGNLLVGFYETSTGSYVTSTWLGETVDGASVQGYNYSGLSSISPSQRNFLPKTTFEYTLLAGGPQVVEIGDGTGTTYYFPIDNYFNYSCTEQIYLASEIGTAGTIDAISFYYNYGTAYTASNVKMYMKNVTRSEFASTGDCEPLAVDDLVWSGNIAPTEAGWYTFTLDTPFEYDGTSNLLVAFYDGTSGYPGTSYTWRQTTTPGSAYMALRYYSDSTNPDPYNLSSYSGNKQWYTYRGNVQIQITPSTSTLAPGFNVTPDPIDLGERPIGAWSEPLPVNLQYGGGTVTVNGFEVDNEFFAINAEVPFTLGEDPVEIEIGVNPEATVSEGTQDGNLVILYTADDRSAIIFPITAYAYEIAQADVVETAIEVTSFPYNSTAPDNMHHNYEIPDADPDGFDAVYKMTFANDVLFSADIAAADGAVALYTEDFDGQDGPNIDNYYEYNGPEVGPGPINMWFSYNYSGSETFFGSGSTGFIYGYQIPAAKLQELGLGECAIVTVETAAYYGTYYDLAIFQGGSQPEDLVYYQEFTDYQELNFFDVNLTEPQFLGDTQNMWVCFNSDSPYSAYTGITPIDANGKIWYSLDGTTWYSSTAYTPLIFVRFIEIPTGREFVMNLADMSVRKVEGKGEVAVSEGSISEGPLFKKEMAKLQDLRNEHNNSKGNRNNSFVDLYVPAGTYYAVFSSTVQNFDVNMDIDEVPVPDPAWVYSPYDGETDVENYYLAQWDLGYYTTEMQVLLDATYPPTTPIIDWTDQLVNSCILAGLDHNKTYFLQINERNQTGTTMGDIIGFTTVIDPVEGFAAESTELYPGDAAVFTWTANDRNLRGYNLYQDGVLVNVEGPISGTTYSVEGLTYNMTGYDFNLTALYDEGESVFSNTVRVKMTGTGTVNGHVWEIDSITPVYNVAIQFRGHDEYGHEQVIDLAEHTNPSGYYEGEVLAGTFTAYGIKDGYVESPSEAITLAYGATVDDNEIYMLEDPVGLGMITATLQEEENNVLVEWSWDPASLIVDFETGDFSQAEFTLPATYPWAISQTNPHGGTYCIKSTCEGVASATSSIEATVEVPYDGKMGFFVKVSSESNYDKFHFYIDGVEQGQALSGVVNWSEKEYAITEGTHTYKWEYTKDSSVNSNDDCVYVDDITMYRLDIPEPPIQGATTYDFENGMQGWTSLDANNDGYGWVLGSEIGGIYLVSGASLAGSGHDSSNDMVCSGSYSNATNQAITPDNYLVSPTQITVSNGAQIRFYACAQDASYAAEHFGVAVSTTTATASAFTMVQEWTMTAKGAQGRTAESEFDVRGTRVQGNWYEYTADLSSFAGQNIWVAIRHFNCNDQFILNVDDVLVADGSAKREGENNRTLQGYTLYRANINGTVGDTLEIAHPAIDVMSYIDNEWASLPYGIYKWGIQARYEGNHHYAEKGNRDLIFIGEGGTTTSNYLPTYNLYNYSLTQQIYTADEIGTAGVINAITFLPQGSITRTLDVYMVNTDKAAFAGSTDWITVTNDDKVFSGSVSMAAPETTITLDSPFTYNGTDNLAIIVNDLTGTWTSSIYYATFAATGQAIRIYQDSAPYNPLAPTSYSGSVMNEKNQIKIDITPSGGSSAAGANNSDILWSNEIEKDMEAQIVFHITLNNDQDPAGATVTMVCGENTYEGTFETDTLAFENVRKGTYQVTAELEGYETVTTELLIEADADYDIFLEEILEVVENLYVSPTGWAIWDTSTATNGPTAGSGSSIGGHTGGGGGGGGGGGAASTFSVDFEDSTIPAGWTTVDANGDGYTWVLGSNIGGVYLISGASLAGSGHNSSNDLICCGSYSNYTGSAITPDDYLVSPQVTLAAGSTFSFWACAQDASYAAEHYGVFVSDNGTSNWTMVQEWTMTSKGSGVQSIGRDGQVRAQGNWYQKSVDLSSYAGEKYIAIRHFNCNDQFILDVDDIELTAGSKGDRAAVMYKVKLDGVYEGETPNMFWQHNEDNLTEGTTYTTSVAPVYATGMGEWVDYTWTYQDCSNFVGATDVTATEDLTNYAVNVSWTMPEGTGPTPPTPPTPGTGQWYYYDDGVCANNIGAGGAFYWASMWPAGSYTGEFVTKVATYDDGYGFTGTVTVYQGGTTAPATAVGTTDVNIAGGANDFVEIEFAEPVAIDDSQNLWIVFYNATSTSYPAATSNDCGDANARWVSLDGASWMDLATAGVPGYSWMIRVYVAEGAKGDVQVIDVPAQPCVNAGALSMTPANRDMWDLVTTFTGTSAGQQAVATDGNFIYTASWQGTPTGGYTFYKYDLDGTFVEGFNIAGATGIRDLTYDGEYFYGTSGATQIFILDLANKTMVGTINCSGLTSRHISYDPERDGFWSGNWSTLALYDRSGNLVQNGPAPSSAYGSAYYKDADGVEHLYLFCQPNSDCKVYDYNIATNTISSSVVYDYTNNVPGCTGIAGGCFIGTYDSKTCWFGNSQQDPNLIAIVELDANAGPTPPPTPVEGIMGSLLLRDGEIIAMFIGDEAGTNSYVDTEVGDGEHEYCVRVIYGGDPDVTLWAMSCPECATVTYTGVVENDVVDNLYPNPTHDVVTIEAQGMNHITVVNTLGQVVYDADVDADMIQLNLGQYKSGLYLVRVNTESGVSVKRVTLVK